MPLREGLTFAHHALVGAGLRDRIRLGASGKIATAFDMARAIALGADWCNAARGQRFHAATLEALGELVAAAGLDHPCDLRPEHFWRRVSLHEVRSFAALFPAPEPGEFLRGTDDPRFRDLWEMADPHSFAPRQPPRGVTDAWLEAASA